VYVLSIWVVVEEWQHDGGNVSAGLQESREGSSIVAVSKNLQDQLQTLDGQLGQGVHCVDIQFQLSLLMNKEKQVVNEEKCVDV
jgi:hypothetical protein